MSVAVGARRGAGVGGARRVVGGSQQQKPSAKLVKWSCFAGPLMVTAIVLFCWGTVATAVVMADVMHTKGVFPFAEMFCRQHGWRYVDRDPETDAPRWVAHC